VYVLDEPTTGLHFEDVRKLLLVLNSLVEKGNTVIVIEHNLDVIKSADWVIDLGPEGGAGGGEVLAVGSPEDLANAHNSHTGTFLREIVGAGRQTVHKPTVKKTVASSTPARKTPARKAAAAKASTTKSSTTKASTTKSRATKSQAS
jgi:excinuclease ABC subunit A